MLLDMKQEAQCVYTARLSSKPYGFRKKNIIFLSWVYGSKWPPWCGQFWALGAICCHGNQFQSNKPKNLKQPFPQPDDVLYEIWSKLANWL